MNDVERLVAVEEIRALIATYAISFDDHDWDRFATLRTEDAPFVVGDDAFEGRETMLAVAWIPLPQNFENAIVARDRDTLVRRDGRRRFAAGASGSTMRTGDG